jgi:TolB-like protein
MTESLLTHLLDASTTIGACRAQVARIMQSADFDATVRERRFFQYVVDETLDGRAARIKAYSVATEVFERDSNFDPQNDPIVRIEAGRLRRALERYYLMSGASDALLITIPKGGYIPTFARRESQRPVMPVEVPALPSRMPTTGDANPPSRTPLRHAAAVLAIGILICAAMFAALSDRVAWQTHPAKPDLPRVLVTRFEYSGSSDSSFAIATGLSREVIYKLSRFKDIVVVEAEIEGTTPARYELRGSVSLSPEAYVLHVSLVNRSDGAVLWAERYNGELSVAGLWQAQSDIADSVAAVIGQMDGVIFTSIAESPPRDAPDDWAAYSCTLSFYAFRATLDRTKLSDVQSCLKQTVANYPDYATAWALLALVEMDTLRSQFPYDATLSRQAIDSALLHARRAVTLDPRNLRGMQAEVVALFFDRQFDQLKEIGARGLALNPNDTDFLGEYGSRLAMSGEWRAGCSLILKARDRRPVPTAYQDTGLALCAYFSGDMTKGMALIGTPSPKSHPLTLLVALIICIEADDQACVIQVRTLLERSAPDLLTNAYPEIAMRLGRPEDVKKVMETLQKAARNGIQRESVP